MKEFLEDYRVLNDATLLAMLDNADGYHGAAVAAMVQVLGERGIEAERPASESIDDKVTRADDLAYSGRVRMIWGGLIGAAGIALSVASGGTVIFSGMALSGAVIFFSGLSTKGRAEELEREIRKTRPD